MTKEQILFKKGLDALEKLDAIKEKRELTFSEREKEDKIKATLFSSLYRYGISLIRTMTQKYKLPSDSYQDMQQDLANIFYEKYRSYDPTQTTPTTFFTPYFRQVISDYIVKDLHKLTQYDAVNVLKVRRAIAYYESKGIEWTTEMLANRTGLSNKVVNSTIYYSYKSNYASVEEAYNLKSSMKTPEEFCMEQESIKTLVNALREHTTPEELHLLLTRVNPLGDKEIPYEKIAKEMDMSVRDVKKKINTCICRLNQDQNLLGYFAKPTLNTYKNTLSLQNEASDVFEHQMDQFLSEYQALSRV